MSRDVLPELRSDYGALEPSISGAAGRAISRAMSCTRSSGRTWARMAGAGRRERLGAALTRDFGGLKQFKRQLIQVAATIMGSGSAALVSEPIVQRLLMTQIYDHRPHLSQGGIPLLAERPVRRATMRRVRLELEPVAAEIDNRALTFLAREPG